ncbi:TOMM precursor leader peptide-binding protein [Streptomyces sp. NPDC090021]|uniref:TOMM precursor leader peptide-binding protein n=1 Tax=Streptomyces sp. NPDC090021 TaxID=3365919 RepID=UPI00382DE215
MSDPLKTSGPIKPALTLLGDDGIIHTTVRAVLAGHFNVRTAEAAAGSVALVLARDDARPDGLAEARKTAEAAGLPWLPVTTESSAVHLGPLTAPTAPTAPTACPSCAVGRRRLARTKARAHQAIRDLHGPAIDAHRSTLLTRPAAAIAARLALGELSLLPGTAPEPASFLRVDLTTLAMSRHRLLPHPGCPDCGGLPDDTAEAARITLRSRPKPAPDVFREQDVTQRATELIERYVDFAAGIIPSVRTERNGQLPRAVALLSSLRGNESQNGWGRTLDFRSARLIAVLETLERFGGEKPRGHRTTVRASRRELGDRAVDPRTFGLYPDDRHTIPGFPYLRYHEDLVVPWVWGYSFARNEPVLVPERYAYYAAHSDDDPRFVYEISNGCAMGGSLEEAILYGLLEVAERDAFLMTWYGRLPVPRIDPSTARDRSIPMLVEHLRFRTDYEIRLYNTTVEQRIPTFWAMALDTTGDTARPKALCVGASALQPEKGVANVLHEMAHLLEHTRIYDAAERERAARMVEDPSLVKIMGDHSLLYSHEAAFDRFEFLLADDREPRSFDDFADQWAWPRHTDLRGDLTELLGRYLDEGLDVLVVDQTTPEHRAGGFACVKVMVPGTLPMTFGHNNRRVDGLPRLLTVPHRLGYRDAPLAPADINPHPHPFP